MARNSLKRKRAAVGTTAVPFLITILVSITLLGSVAYYFYHRLTVRDQDLQPMIGATTSISDSDIKEILFVLQPDDTERLPAVMLFMFDPVRKVEYCIGIPTTLVLNHDGQEMTVLNCLQNHGVSNLQNDLSKLLDQNIDYYVQMNSTSFQQLISIFGNVSYSVTIWDNGLRPSDSTQELDAAQYETLITSHEYYSEEERSAVISFSISSLLNQCNGSRISQNLDGYFSSIINQVSTNVTAMDFSDHRHAISYMFEHAESPARGLTLSYETRSDNLLTLSSTAAESLKVTFSQKTAEDSES